MSDVGAITKRELSLISRFVALLQEEQEILKRADSAALEATSTAKLDLVGQLNALEAERRVALGIAGEKDTRQAMIAWLKNHPEATVSAADWENLLNLASEAKQLHEINARLVGMHLQQTSEALTVLTRHSQQQTLYGSNGQAAQISGSRIVDSA